MFHVYTLKTPLLTNILKWVDLKHKFQNNDYNHLKGKSKLKSKQRILKKEQEKNCFVFNQGKMLQGKLDSVFVYDQIKRCTQFSKLSWSTVINRNTDNYD